MGGPAETSGTLRLGVDKRPAAAHPPTHSPPVAGCWCAAGLVLDAGSGRCVRPRECPCQVGGLRYRPGQPVKVNCRLCTCLDGQLRRCRQNPDCTGGSWHVAASRRQGGTGGTPADPVPPIAGSALRLVGVVGVGRVPGSLRLPERPVVLPQPHQPQPARQRPALPRHLPQGPQVRWQAPGVASGRVGSPTTSPLRRCQTAPCRQCQYQGRRRVPGERWRGGPCHVCQCLPSLAVRCSPYCFHRAAGCPQVRAGGAGASPGGMTLPAGDGDGDGDPTQGQVLVEGHGDSCCYCAPAGESGGAGATAGGGGGVPTVWGLPQHELHGGCPHRR